MPPTAVDPAEVLEDHDPDALPAEQPPAAANYRSADMRGISCMFCSKFQFDGEVQEGDGFVPTGICQLWEARVRGDHVSDGFSDPGPPLDDSGNEIWDFSEGERQFAEIHLSGSDTIEEDGYVVKEILRTGEWPVIPTGDGIVEMPLKVVRDGKSDKTEGTISMSELVENFKAGAINRVQVPLSDDDKDHKNITRVNTGYVRDLWIKDEDDTSKLVAKIEFTEPEVKDKTLRGTYADVSCGIPWKVTSRGREYGAVLEHVAITNRPFIDGLGPFLAASDTPNEDVEVVCFSDDPKLPAPDAAPVTEPDKGDDEEQQEEPEAEEQKPNDSEEEPEVKLSYRQQQDGITTAITSQLGLSNAYVLDDIEGNTATITNEIAETTWNVPFEIEGESIKLAAVKDWEVVKDEGEEDATPASSASAPRQLSELEQARRLRELRLSQSNGNDEGGSAMPGTTLDIAALDGVELSDDQKAAIQSVLDENASLKARTREQEAEARIDELKELGLSDRPGALKFYRQVFLSDDGGPAVVLLSDNGQEKERVTALEVLDKFIEGVKGSDGKVNLSDQALASGNDDPPPADTGEEASVEDRVAEAREALYGKKK